MPLTAAEKQRRLRERKKADGTYDEYRQKQAESSKRSYLKKKAKINALPSSDKKKQLAEIRKNTNKRVKKCRNKKRQAEAEKTAKPTAPFNSAQAFAKAAARARHVLRKSLPSPRRRKAVTRKLYEEERDKTPEPKKRPRPHGNALSDETIDKVKRFYEQDDISRQAPGRKDCITIRNNDGSKEKTQIRHMVNSLNETYALFKKKYPLAKVGSSKFAELRPKHVQLSNKLPHNVCLCKYHENFIFAVDALHKANPNFPTYTHNLPETLLCPSPTEECWLNECPNCQDCKGFKDNYSFEDASEPTYSWYVWKNVENNRITKTVEDGTIEDLLEHMCSLIPKFLEHCYVKRKQADAYNKERDAALSETYNPETALLQVDFSENYTCVHQDEVQSAHWHQSQVTLFTAAIYHTGKEHSKVIVSDNLSHTKETLVAYVDKLLEDLPPAIQVVSVWSDGPSTQFKNKFIAASIPALEQKHNLKIKWNYFATSHGKGPVDGIGGSTKRFVWQNVSSRKNMVKDAASFVAAASKMPKVQVEEMNCSSINERNSSLGLDNVFENAAAIKSIASMHFIEIVNGKAVASITTEDQADEEDDDVDMESCDGVAPLPEDIPSCSTNDLHGHKQSENNSLKQSNNSVNNDIEIKVGNWFLVDYDGEYFPGEVLEEGEEDDFLISVMHSAGKYWKWPSPKDTTFYLKEKIIRKLGEPVVVNHREHYKFHDL